MNKWGNIKHPFEHRDGFAKPSHILAAFNLGKHMPDGDSFALGQLSAVWEFPDSYHLVAVTDE